MMTPTEAKRELQDLSRRIGPQADMFVGICKYHSEALDASVYPQGIGGGRSAAFIVRANDWPELIAALNAKWDEFKDVHQARVVKDMALEVIRITAEFGQCSDAALREKFSAEEVARYGADACAKADEMAANGPFSIVTVGAANAA